MASNSLDKVIVRDLGDLTEEELFIGTLRHLNSFHLPWIEDDWLNEGRVLEIVVTQTATSPTLFVLDLSPQLFLGPQTWHIVLLLLNDSMTSIYW